MYWQHSFQMEVTIIATAFEIHLQGSSYAKPKANFWHFRDISDVMKRHVMNMSHAFHKYVTDISNVCPTCIGNAIILVY